VDVIGLLVSWANDNNPVAFEDVFQLHLDLLRGFVLIVTLHLGYLMDNVNHYVLNVGSHFWPLDWSNLCCL
jgi:hypothetical protein